MSLPPHRLICGVAFAEVEARCLGPSLKAFKTFARKLKAAIQLAVHRDRRLHDLRSEEATLCRDRDKGKKRLGKRMVGLRRMIRGAYVDPDLPGLSLDAPNPKEPTAFLRKCELAVDRLGGEIRARLLGKALFHSVQDPKVHCRELTPEVRALKKTLEQLVKVRRRIDAMLEKRKEAVAEYDRIFLRTARMFEDLCRLAGYDRLAERVRPSTRNPGRTEEKADVDVAAVEAALDDGERGDGERRGEDAAVATDPNLTAPDATGQSDAAAPASAPSRASPEARSLR